MKCAVEIDSGGMTYVPSFMKIGSGTRKLIRGIHRWQGDLTSLILFFQNKKSRLKWEANSSAGDILNPNCGGQSFCQQALKGLEVSFVTGKCQIRLKLCYMKYITCPFSHVQNK
jgi:hypothetical protein